MAYCAVLMHRIIMKVYEVESHFLRCVYKSYCNLVLLDLDLSNFLVMIFIGKNASKWIDSTCMGL